MARLGIGNWLGLSRLRHPLVEGIIGRVNTVEALYGRGSQEVKNHPLVLPSLQEGICGAMANILSLLLA